MRYVGDIITAIRNRTGNQQFTIGSDTTVVEDVQEGIGNQTILEFINEGQAQLQASIINTHPVEFVVSKEISIVANQEEYSIPDNVFINNRILNMQYSHDGQAKNYVDLEQLSIENRNTDTCTHPTGWIRRSGNILLTPIPLATSAKIRPEYYRELDQLQVRAGTLDGGLVTLPFGTEEVITADTLSLDVADDLPTLIDNVVDKYLCIVDKDGNVVEYNIPYTAYNSTTGDFTHPAHTRTGTTSLDITGNQFVVIGRYATTHSDLPNHCERYLKAYAQMRVMALDSNVDIQQEEYELQRIEASIVDSFGDVNEDVQYFPEINKDILW